MGMTKEEFTARLMAIQKSKIQKAKALERELDTYAVEAKIKISKSYRKRKHSLTDRQWL